MPNHQHNQGRKDDRISIFAIINPITIYVALFLYGLLRFLASRSPYACRATICSA